MNWSNSGLWVICYKQLRLRVLKVSDHLRRSCKKLWFCVVVFWLWEVCESEMRVSRRGCGGARRGKAILLFFCICDSSQFFIRWVFLTGHQASISTCHFLFWIWAVTNSERGETMRTGGEKTSRQRGVVPAGGQQWRCKHAPLSNARSEPPGHGHGVLLFPASRLLPPALIMLILHSLKFPSLC